MDQMIPIESGFPIRQDQSGLIGVSWTPPNALLLDFDTGKQTIRVQFERILAYRILDEVLDSIDGDMRKGADPAGFAYEVQNGTFLTSYPNIDLCFSHPSNPIKQYALISLSWCVEVLTDSSPTFCSVG
ncbi:MAG: hypothetical protein KGJ73_01825 [Rhodospirillales bacterium]|nr:hypothetical protein [Rhodospirillales bacterium]